ncbi:MAG: glycosyltransferase [Chloroflexi bacterium]|nr:glycosyltransferase [Chloroflexota bacterium]
MRIGIVTGEYPPMQGGVGAYSRILAHMLREQGHTVYVLSRAETHDDTISLTNTITRWGPHSLRIARRWAQAHNLDIVNLQFQTAAYTLSPWIHWLPDALDHPVVTTFHDLRFPYLFPKAGPLRDWIVMRLARRSAGVIATNHEDHARLDHLPCTALIPIGSNIRAALPAAFDRGYWRAQAGATPGDFLLAYFGLINRSKGIETLLESLAALHKASIPVRLVMIGAGAGSSDPTNRTYIAEIEALIERLGLSAIIHQTGYVDNEAVAAYLSAADVVVLPFTDGASYRRGSLMAGLHYGCTIVTTTPHIPIPGFRDGDNLRCFPTGDSATLTAILRELFETPEHRERLQAGARQRSTEFEWPTIAAQTTTLFERILGAAQ